ncbi:hypothetical protein J3R30DRAFT_3418936 [Lentinula aciculospora]|uniref:RING-type domain-containing protein n=1 Tax=Lentinula aciculospora TaxID=153920 RepID=A0A9W9AVR0_9AGAR|nr:hypothetical protein J3R30DRAFT_3418936 [Lentinula aciculospora]
MTNVSSKVFRTATTTSLSLSMELTAPASRQRPSRTRSLPARINHTSQVLASISEEHNDDHDQGAILPGAKTIAQPKQLQWKSTPSSTRNQTSASGTGPRSTLKNKINLRIRTKVSTFDNDRDCGICFDPAVRPSRTKCCGKMFCEDHLHDWLNGSSNSCPVCASNCHPQTGTISLAPPMTPTIHNVPQGFISTPRTPPTPSTPPSRGTPTILMPLTPHSLPLPLLIHRPSPMRPTLTHLTFINSPGSGSESGSGSDSENSVNSPSSSSSTALLPMLNAVSQTLTQKIARGLARRDTNNDEAYYSEPAADSDAMNTSRVDLDSPLSLSRSSSTSFVWKPLSMRPSSYFPFDFDFQFDFKSISHSPNRPSSPFPLFSPTCLGGFSCGGRNSSESSSDPSNDPDVLAQGLTDLGSKMLARVLSMVAMVLIFHVLFIGRTRSGLPTLDVLVLD